MYAAACNRRGPSTAGNSFLNDAVSARSCDQAVTPQHFLSIIFLPFGVRVITTSTFLPQYRQSCCADFASWRAATLVFDFLPSPAMGTVLLVNISEQPRATRRVIIPNLRQR